MPRYFFALHNNDGSIEDVDGVDLPDDRAATAYGCGVARELMRHNEAKSRPFCIVIRDETGAVRFKVPFSSVDQSINHLSPEARALVERACERRRDLAEVVQATRRTARQARALIARSRGRPYLLTLNGRPV